MITNGLCGCCHGPHLTDFHQLSKRERARYAGLMSLTLIAIICLGAWLNLLFFRSGFWRADERLPYIARERTPAGGWPEIAVIIPARNEAKTIGPVITAHMKCDYPGEVSYLLVDDGSADETAELAAAAAADAPRRLSIIPTPDLPPGWTGKVWAIQQGLAHVDAQTPDTKYVLFTDADIVLAPDTLRLLTFKAERETLSVASLMARLDVRGVWGALLIPAFIYFFQKLYPFRRANDVNDPSAAAAGGCMLVRRSALCAIDGMQQIKGELIDDCALARAIKNLTPDTKIWIGHGDDAAQSLRDNRSLSSVWHMVARTAYAQLHRSPLLLSGAVAGMALLYLAPPLITLGFAWHGEFWALALALTAWGLMAYSYWPTLRLYDQEPGQAVLLPVAGALYTAMTVTSAYRHARGRGGQWKGRTY